uniref:Serine/threonine protein kinase n=1 Tax=Mimivirus LCMiAC01 TaxID=2506608 RepID=A0A481Z0Q6_9VIRU|nr:MAG: serine/threonine protein kinase [Mimivirus LCMiAC01]
MLNNLNIPNLTLYIDNTKKYEYVYDKLIGTGCSSRVFLAHDIKTNEKVAIKRICISKIIQKKMKRKIEREIAIMKLLDHPNCIGYKNVVQDKQYVYIILEYVNGRELFNILKKKKLDDQEIFHYFSQLVWAIDYMHGNLICHRDIKPENIMLDMNGHVKLCDFGLAKLLGSTYLTGTKCGSPHYVAPEVILSDILEYDGMKADIWSMGVCLYAFATNSLPFLGDNIVKVMDKIISGQYHFPKDIDPEIKDLISHMLHSKQEKRYSIDDVKKHKWFCKHYKNKMELNKNEINDNSNIDDIMNDRILTIFNKLGWNNKTDLMIRLHEYGNNIEKVIFKLLQNRIMKGFGLPIVNTYYVRSEIDRNVKSEINKINSDKFAKNKGIGSIFRKIFQKKNNLVYNIIIKNITREQIIHILQQIFIRMKVIYNNEGAYKLKIDLTESDIKYNVTIEEENENSEVCIKFKLLNNRTEYIHNLICESFRASIKEEVDKYNELNSSKN